MRERDRRAGRQRPVELGEGEREPRLRDVQVAVAGPGAAEGAGAERQVLEVGLDAPGVGRGGASEASASRTPASSATTGVPRSAV